MKLTKKQINELKEITKPIMKFLSENFHPHVKVIIENDKAELLECVTCIKCEEFILD